MGSLLKNETMRSNLITGYDSSLHVNSMKIRHLSSSGADIKCTSSRMKEYESASKHTNIGDRNTDARMGKFDKPNKTMKFCELEGAVASHIKSTAELPPKTRHVV
jgi:hypothetical protein